MDWCLCIYMTVNTDPTTTPPFTATVNSRLQHFLPSATAPASTPAGPAKRSEDRPAAAHLQPHANRHGHLLPSPDSSPLSADPSASLSGSTNRPNHSSHSLHPHQPPLMQRGRGEEAGRPATWRREEQKTRKRRQKRVDLKKERIRSFALCFFPLCR